MAEDLYRKNFERNAKSYISKLYSEDQEDVSRFRNDLLANGYSLVSIRRGLDRPFKDLTKDNVKSLVAKLERKDCSDWTKHDHKVILRKYMRWLGKEDTVNWMKIRQPKNGQLPQEILTEEDVRKLVEVAYTARNRAFVLTLYESGCRIKEFLPLKLGRCNSISTEP
jgi:site-specific recombinase XerD